VNKSLLARWRSNFLTGLVVILPGVISIAVVIWLFRNVSNLTDTLLFFFPRGLTHSNHGEGELFWYWSATAFILAICLICTVGVAARNYVGKKMIEWVDRSLMHVPFLNKIYGATKQVNEALTSGNRNSFKTVVLIEYPHPGTYSLGFLTSEEQSEAGAKLNQKLVCVFIPTTPNPTSGFLLLVPEHKVTRLEMSVAEGIKYIISLGSIAPGFATTPAEKPQEQKKDLF
jgi:uncharacterized membrane protein